MSTCYLAYVFDFRSPYSGKAEQEGGFVRKVPMNKINHVLATMAHSLKYHRGLADLPAVKHKVTSGIVQAMIAQAQLER